MPDIYDFIQQANAPVAESAARNATATDETPEVIGRRLQIVRDNALDGIAHDAEDFWNKEDHYRKARGLFMKNPAVANWFAQNPQAAPLFSGELSAAARVGDLAQRDPDQWKEKESFSLFPSTSPEARSLFSKVRIETARREQSARESAADDSYALTDDDAVRQSLQGMDEQATVQKAADAVLTPESSGGSMSSGAYVAGRAIGWTDSAVNGWRNGMDQTELAELHSKVLKENRDYTAEEEAKVKELNARMDARREVDGGILFSNAEVLGNMLSGLSPWDAAYGAATTAALSVLASGASTGAAVGAGVGSVVPGAGTAAGAAVGAFAGATLATLGRMGLAYAFTQSTMRQEGGTNYRQQIENGVDRGAARLTAAGVGLFSAVVEMGLIEKLGGLYKNVTAPLFERFFSKRMAEAAPSLGGVTMRGALMDFGKATAGGLLVYEPGEEMIQEVGQIVGEEIGKRFSSDPAKAAPVTVEEAADRLAETYVETIKAVFLIQLVGGSPLLAHNLRQARRAEKNREYVENIAAYAKESKAAKIDPKTVEDFIASQTEPNNTDKIYIEAAMLRQEMRNTGITDEQLAAVDPEAKARLDRAEREGNGGDVVFDTGKFAVEIAGTDLGLNLKQHMRLAPDALSVAEANQARAKSKELAHDLIFYQAHPEAADKAELTEQASQVYDDYLRQLAEANDALQAANPGRLPMTREQIRAQAKLAAIMAQSLMASTNLPYETVRRMLPKVMAGDIEPSSLGDADADGAGTLRQDGAPFEKITPETRLGGQTVQEWIAGMQEDGKSRAAESAEKIDLLQKLLGAESEADARQILKKAKDEGVSEESRKWLSRLLFAKNKRQAPEKKHSIRTEAEAEASGQKTYHREGLARKEDSASAEIIDLEDPSVPAFKTMSELRDWAIRLLADGGDVTIKATGQRVHFTKPGIRASLKKHRIPGQKNAYKALRRLIESAEYDYSVQKDARHKDQDDTEGLDVYRAALRMGGKLYAVTISNDILSERGLKRMTKAALSLKIAHYKDHEPAEIEIAPGVLNRDGLMAAPKEEPPRPTALSRISLGILRGTVKPSKVVGETLLQDTAELNNSLVRGSYDPAANRIYLTPNADLSTFAHEMSHAYLTQLFNLAAISDKGSRAAKDAEILLKAFGLSSLEEYAGLSSPPEGFERLRKIQEWWAYNTEMYLSRGTGADPKAAGVLKKFGAWVRNVYKQYAGGADGYLNLLFRNEFGEDMWKMSDEVRGVMERMFAAESAFIRSEQASGLEPFFKKKPEGMSDEAWGAYLEALEVSRLEGIDRLQEASLSQMKWLSGARGRILKEIQSQYSKARRIAKEAAEEAIHAMKCMNLLDDLKEPGFEENAEGEALPRPRLKIAAEWLEEQGYSKEQIAKLRRLGVVASEEKGGLPPDVVAGLVGERYEITTGREMVDLLMTVPDDVSAEINRLADQYMLQEHAEMQDPAWQERQAIAALHSEARLRMVSLELKHFMKATNGRVLQNAAKMAAHDILMGTKVEDISAKRYQMLAARCASNALKLLQKGDMEGAVNAKRQQLVNMHMAREALEIEQDRGRLDAIRKRAFKADKKLASSRDMNLVLAVRAIFSAYGMGPEDVRDPLDCIRPIERYAPEDYQAIREIVEPHLGLGVPMEQMTAQQMTDLLAAVKALWEQSRAVKQIEIDGQKMDLEAALGEMEQEFARFPSQKAGTDKGLTAKDKRTSALMSFNTTLKRVEHWCNRMDGSSTRKPFTRYIYRPISIACTEYRTESVKYIDKYRQLLKPMVAQWAKAPNISGKRFGIDYTFTKFELIGALLHTGNYSNLQKLLAGRDKAHP